MILDGLKPGIRTALPLIEKVFDYHNLVMVVTSTTEDVPWKARPAHEDGRAVDLRAHQVNPYLIPEIVRGIKRALGIRYLVAPVLAYPNVAHTHIHVEEVV